MKITTTPTAEFTPVTVSITLESRDEIGYLRGIVGDPERYRHMAQKYATRFGTNNPDVIQAFRMADVRRTLIEALDRAEKAK